LQNLGCQILVAHDAKGCYEILPSLWQLLIMWKLHIK
jgi:hypothetical protein